MEFNINDYVFVQLTDRGKRMLEENHRRIFSHFERPGCRPPPFELPKEDENGWSKWQLWKLMEEFGPHIRLSADPPFRTTIRLGLSSGAAYQQQHGQAADQQDA